MKEIVLEMYRQGLSSNEIEELTGLVRKTVKVWCQKAGIIRTQSEAYRISNAKKGECNPSWKGDNVGYVRQHQRGRKDFPKPLGICQMPGCKNPAIERARIDHSNLPYRKEYVMIMCHSCNMRHAHNKFLILFEPIDN